MKKFTPIILFSLQRHHVCRFFIGLRSIRCFFLLFCLLAYTSISLGNFPTETVAWKSPMLDDGRRYMSLMMTNDNEDDQYLDVIENAHSKGFNAVYLTVRMDAVKCHNQQCVIGSSINPSWNPANRSWTQIDAQVGKAKQLGMKIALRIHLGNSDFGGNIRSNYLWGPGRLAEDQNGNTELGGWNFTKFTLSSQPAIDSAKSFVQEVLNRYGYLEGESNLLFVSFSNTSSQELEYDGSNMIDYSPASKNEYASWYLTNYGVPNPNVPTDFTSTEGKKWYKFRHCKLKDFVSQLSGVVRNHNSSIKIIHDVGSAFDGMSSKRGTLGFKSLAEHSDGFKVNDDFHYDHRFSMDILRGSLPGKFVMNEAFLVGSYSAGFYSNFANDVFTHGGKMLAVVSVNNGLINQYAGDWSSISTTWLAGSNGNMSPVNANGTVNYTFNEILNASFSGNTFTSGARNIYGEWQTQYNNNPGNGKPVNVVLDDSELSCSSCTPPSAPTLSASPSTINVGDSTTLSASGCAGTITWSDGLGTGTTKRVSPSATKTYTASCTVNSCVSSPSNVTVTVNTGGGSNPCSLVDKQTIGTWNGLNVQGRQFTVNGNPTWLIVTAINGSPTDKHFPRGANFADDGGVSWSSGSYSSSCFGGGVTDWWGLVKPSGITTPTGYVAGTENDGAEYFELASCTPPSAPTLSASPSTINAGDSTTLSASGCSGTVTWSHGLGTGSTKKVGPTSNITYTATCTVNSCTSGNGSVTVTVNQPSGINCNTLLSDVNGVNCLFVEGWIYDPSNPNTTINIDIYEGATLLVSNYPANKFRQDLLNVGYGTGHHAFELNTPSQLRDGNNHTLTFKATACPNYQFGNSPFVFVSSGCSNSVLGEEVENIIQQKELKVFPNPSKGMFDASFYLERGKKATISIVDIQGRIVHQQQIVGHGSHREKINLSNKASGTLMMRLITDKGVEVRKLNVTK